MKIDRWTTKRACFDIAPMSISNKAYTFPAQPDGSPERKVSLSSVEAGEFFVEYLHYLFRLSRTQRNK